MLGIQEMPQRREKRKLSNRPPRGDIVKNKQGNSTERFSYALSYPIPAPKERKIAGALTVAIKNENNLCRPFNR